MDGVRIFDIKDIKISDNERIIEFNSLEELTKFTKFRAILKHKLVHKNLYYVLGDSWVAIYKEKVTN